MEPAKEKDNIFKVPGWCQLKELIPWLLMEPEYIMKNSFPISVAMMFHCLPS